MRWRTIGLLWLLLSCLSAFCFSNSASATFATPFFRGVVTFVYDGQNQTKVAYDGGGGFVVGYDTVAMLSKGEIGYETTGDYALIGKFGKFLAAGTTAAEGAGAGLKLASGAQDMVAGTQNGILLGTVENGQVNLFQAAAGQIEGHADLLKAGLASPAAQGFSIGVQNGQVTAIFQNSILNPASANYLLPAQTTQQILQTLGATGAKLFP